MFRKTNFLLRFEVLDDRLVPAGNVAAAGGEVLQLRGDGAANQVRITHFASGGIRVDGLTGTTINGQPSVWFNGSGLEKVDIKLFGGNDRLEINSLRASVDQNIDMDVGDDAIFINWALAGVNLSIKTGDGFDSVAAHGVRTGGDFYVETGQGRSDVRVSGGRIGRTLTVIGGDGIDRVGVTQTTTGADLNVEGKKGDDRVDLIDVRSNRNIKVVADVGNDYVLVRNVVAAKDAVFLGGDGFDTFQNRGVSGGEKLEIEEFNRFV